MVGVAICNLNSLPVIKAVQKQYVMMLDVLIIVNYKWTNL